MTDRVPGNPGQYSAVVTAAELAKMQTGEAFNITLTRDDNPITPGTPYSKAAVLPAELATLLCPDIDDPTPADALAALQALVSSAQTAAGAAQTDADTALARGYIEESGDGYIKYSSGIMQCYGIINFTVAASGASAWGSMYTASTNVTANFAKAFIESPVSITAGVGVNWALLIQSTFSYTGVTRIILAADSAASLNGKSFRIYYNAFGRWK